MKMTEKVALFMKKCNSLRNQCCNLFFRKELDGVLC